MRAVWAAALVSCGLVQPGMAFLPGGSSNACSTSNSERVKAQAHSVRPLHTSRRRNRALRLKMGETLDPSSKRTDIILALVAGAAIGGFVAYTMVQTGNLTHKFDNLEKTISALSDKFDTFSKSVSDDMDTLKMQLNMLLGIGAASAFVVSSPTLSFFVKKAKEGLQAITGSDQEATDAKQKLEEKPNAKSSKQ